MREETDVRVAGPGGERIPDQDPGQGGDAFPAPIAETPAREPTHEHGRERERLLDGTVADGFHERWREVQSGFVDDPRDAVRRADELAAEVVNAVGQALAARKRVLDDRLHAGGEDAPDTERLRLALRDYRDFVDRTLTI